MTISKDNMVVDHIDQSPIDIEKTMPNSEVSFTPEEEKQAVRKLDWCLMPLLGALYLVSYIDRGNIGNAYTAGMGKAWGITSDQYAWAVTIYYIAYILGHPMILVWKVVKLPLWVAIMAFGWGSISMIQAATSSFSGLMACRFLIGAFEAGYAPGVALYLSFFYHRQEMGLRYGLFISFSPLASCFASALAYGIVHAKTSIESWQLIFIVEGAPTLFLAILAYYMLPSSPSECPFLDERQNQIVGYRASHARGEKAEDKKLNFNQVFAAFYDYKNYLQALIIFCLNTAFGSLPAFLPTIIRDIGYTSVTAQGLSAPPYLAAYFCCLCASVLSDRFRNRGWFIIGFCCVGGAGYTILATTSTLGVRYFATFLACAGTFPAVALTFTWVTDNQGSASKRGAGLAIFGMFGQCGPILGARIFPSRDGPIYVKGMSICAGLLFLAAFTAFVLSMLLRLQNRSRNKKHGKPEADYVPDDVADLGDAHPMYRFVP